MSKFGEKVKKIADGRATATKFTISIEKADLEDFAKLDPLPPSKQDYFEVETALVVDAIAGSPCKVSCSPKTGDPTSVLVVWDPPDPALRIKNIGGPFDHVKQKDKDLL